MIGIIKLALFVVALVLIGRYLIWPIFRPKKKETPHEPTEYEYTVEELENIIREAKARIEEILAVKTSERKMSLEHKKALDERIKDNEAMIQAATEKLGQLGDL